MCVCVCVCVCGGGGVGGGGVLLMVRLTSNGTSNSYPYIKSISEALQLVDRITCFTRQYEDGKTNQSLEVVTEKLQDIMLRGTLAFDVR